MFTLYKLRRAKPPKKPSNMGRYRFWLANFTGLLLAMAYVVWQHSAEVDKVKDNLTSSLGAYVAEKTGDRFGGDFSLINQDGKVETERDFAGRYLMVYFGYTSCPDMCPTGLDSMTRALNLLTPQELEKVQPLFITIDPERDTPEKIKSYDSAFHPKIIGLTGTPAQIAKVAGHYQVFYQKDMSEAGDGPDPEYTMVHSTQIFVVAPNGRVESALDEEAEPQKLVEALRKAWKNQP